MKTYYAIELTKRGSKVSRYALYWVDREGKLDAEWPEDSHNGAKAALLPNQIYYKGGNKEFPAFHFMIGNIGYNKLQRLSEDLTRHFKDRVDVLLISGWAPSTR